MASNATSQADFSASNPSSNFAIAPHGEVSERSDPEDQEGMALNFINRIAQAMTSDRSTTVKVTPASDLPMTLRHKDDNGAVYKRTNSVLVDDYRSSDRLSFGRDFETVFMTRKKAVVCFEAGDHTIAIGGIWSNPSTNVRVILHPDTQIPSVELCIKRGGGKPLAIVRVFANSILRTGNGWYGFQICHSEWQAQDIVISDTPQTPIYTEKMNALLAEGNLMQIKLRLVHQTHVSYEQNIGADYAPPVWTGISPTELELLKADYMMIKSAQLLTRPVSEDDLLIGALQVETEFDISRILICKEVGAAERFSKFMECAMYNSCFYGNLWFYQHVFKEKLIDMTFTNSQKYPPPRWMINNFVSKVNELGVMTEAVPLSWAEYKFTRILPDHVTAANLYRLAVARDSDANFDEMQAAFDNQKDLWALFYKDPRKPDHHRVDIAFQIQGWATNRDTLYPEAGTACKITVKGGHVLKGHFCIQLFNREYPCSAWVRMVTPGKFDYEDADHSSITVEIEKNTQTRKRQLAAVGIVAQGPLRPVGDDIHPDCRHFMLRAPRTVKDTMNGWESRLTQPHKDRYLSWIANNDLNAEQKAGFTDVLTNQTGITTIIGPPGTGKTKVISKVVPAYLDSNLMHFPDNKTPIVILAPTQVALENIMERLIVVFRALNVAIKMTRFRGSNPPSRDVTGAELGDVELEEIEQAFWDHVGVSSKKLFPELKQYEFHAQFGAFLNEVVANPLQDAVLFRQVVDYIRAKDKVNKAKNAKGRKLLEDKLEDAMVPLLEAYWGTVDIVFATLNNAGHENLCRYFKPRFIIIDEAAMASLPDLMTGVAAFQDSFWHLMMCGDPTKYRGRADAAGRNEFGACMRNSIMEEMLNDPACPLSHVFLKVQYRMAPQIGNLISELFYDGKLENHPSTAIDTDMDITCKAFFRSFGHAYNNSNIVAIDTGEGAHSEKYSTGASLFNKNEITIATDL